MRRFYKTGFRNRNIRKITNVRGKDRRYSEYHETKAAKTTETQRYSYHSTGKKGSSESSILSQKHKRAPRSGDILSIIKDHGLNKEFPLPVEAEASKVRKTVTKQDLKKRADLRAENIFTIDGADAKDFDDAVSIKRTEDGNYRLGVHIADVSHYVEEDSGIDREALKRGTSIYLIDQVAPMLPLALSNGICSLNPGEDRLTLTLDMLVSPDGVTLTHELFESVINSKARLIYTDVSDLLEKSGTSIRIPATIHEDLFIMEELAEILQKKRLRRGSIDFELDEAEIELDEFGFAINVKKAERRVANRIIEEFMLLANETIAEAYHKEDEPFIYRVHEKPDGDKLMHFKTFLDGLGIRISRRDKGMLPSDFAGILKKVKNGPFEKAVNTVMLRTMQKACYDSECKGHFGLSVKYYCHFTSPIRRYPDLIIHRIIKECMRGRPSGKRRRDLFARTAEAAALSSETERKALELEREVEKVKKAEYMSRHIGETYEGLISGVLSFGFFVELPNTVEGLVSVNSLWDDYYIFEAESFRLTGELTKRSFSIGDAVCVAVESVDIEKHEIDFRLVEYASVIENVRK